MRQAGSRHERHKEDRMPNIIPATIDDDMPADFTVIATTPAAMIEAQKSLIAWADRKIEAVKAESKEAIEQLAIAVQRKWKTDAWRRQVAKFQKRVEFYEKIKAALNAGYYIVPPFPIDVFAIRTSREAPKPKDCAYRNNHDQDAQVLPAGEGRYVSPVPVIEPYVEEEIKDGKSKEVTYYHATEFADVEFPFKLARSEIRDATNAAMALGIFDRLGVLPRVRSPDPLVCGQIIVPNQPGYYHADSLKVITFFVAWWLDTKTI
jgi:hypothetical protein